MKNRIVLFMVVLLAGLIGATASHAQEPVNLLTNGGFETGDQATWGGYGTRTQEVVTQLVGASVAEDVIEGDYCLHLVVPNAGANFWDVGLQNGGHTFGAGKKYTLSAFMKTNSGTLTINFKPELAQDPWTAYGEQQHTITDTWQEYYVTTPIFASDVTPGSLTWHIAFAPGNFWVDNVKWYEGDYVPTPLVRLKAHTPSPANGALKTELFASLGWKAGDTAATHDIYVGTNESDVEAGTGGTFRKNQAQSWYVIGITGYPYPAGLEYGQTYYWRIDEVEQDGITKHKGDVWSFFIPPKKAYNPMPVDGSAFVALDTDLTWTAGHNAGLHHVYFGTDYDTVAGGSGAPPTGETTYDPGILELNTTYYWRVDEFDGSMTHTGDVWSFTTTLEGLGELGFERWLGDITIDELRNMINSGVRQPDEVDVVTTGFDWDGPDTEGYGAKISGWLYAPATGNFTFWLVTDDQGRLNLSSDQDPDNMTEIARESSWNDRNMFIKGGEEESDPIPLVAGEKYYIEAIWQEGTGGDHCQVAWAGPGIGSDPKIIASSYVSLFNPVEAYGASPGNKAVDVRQDAQLRWKAGKHASSHRLFFGTSEAAVAAATTGSPEFKGNKTLGNETHDPGILSLATTYYWRVDEVNSTHPDSPWKGNVWSFTVGDFLLIDDMEDYNNFAPDRIFETWSDGWGDSGNGSIIGYPEPDFDAGETFVETSIVHGGDQSMPFFYENNMKYSEASRTLPAHLRDWTQEGVKALSLWYYGYAASQGAFVEGPAGTYTMTGAGYDIWATDIGEEDEFHYAWKVLQGAGSITARVSAVSGQNLNEWAKAGLMIRETLDPNSAHAFMCLTSAQGVAFQYRPEAAGTSVNHDQRAGASTRPKWLKLDRDFSGTFTASHANDVGGVPDKWTALNTTNLQLASTVYIGLALTSHQRYVSATATFSNITTTGNVTVATFTAQDIGITSNAPESMYVAIKDAQGRTATVYNTDSDAANVTSWTAWGEFGQGIALSEFTDKTPALNLSNIDTISIGFGTKGSAQPGGGGLMFFDDIRLYKPRCYANLAKPALDFSSNCVVDMPDLEILTDNWLKASWEVTPVAPTTAGLVGYYRLENNAQDSSGQGNHGTAVGGPAYVAGQIGQALDFDGTGSQYVDLGTLDPSAATGHLSVALWARWDGLSGSYQGLIGKRDTWNANEMMWNIEANVDTGTLGFFREGSYIDDGDIVLPIGVWTHVAATFDGTTAAFYIDGSMTGSGGFSFGGDTEAALVFGAVEGGGGNPFNGALDEVRLYNRALSQAEVASLAGKTSVFNQDLTMLLRPHDANIDVNGDGAIDFLDYAGLIDSWLDEVLWPAN